jgi:hypothetical protein
MLQPSNFEFTSHDTPQHNSLAELAFPYLAGKARAMMGGAMVPDDATSKGTRGNILGYSIRWASHG